MRFKMKNNDDKEDLDYDSSLIMSSTEIVQKEYSSLAIKLEDMEDSEFLVIDNRLYSYPKAIGKINPDDYASREDLMNNYPEITCLDLGKLKEKIDKEVKEKEDLKEEINKLKQIINRKEEELAAEYFKRFEAMEEAEFILNQLAECEEELHKFIAANSSILKEYRRLQERTFSLLIVSKNMD